jgi:hypothetical protein
MIQRVHKLLLDRQLPAEKQKSFTSSRFTSYLFLLVFYLTIISFLISCLTCGVNVEDPTPPSKPQWIEKSDLDAWPERGIDAHESVGIYLEWGFAPDEDIMAYNLYRATWFDAQDSLGDYSLITRMETESLLKHEYIDRQVSTGSKYFYKLNAEDASNNISEYSDSTYYTLATQISSEYLTPNGRTVTLGSDRTLTWVAIIQIDLKDFYLTLLSDENELMTRIFRAPTNYTGLKEKYVIPDSIALVPGTVYQWRIDIETADEYSSSESPWAPFLYAGE